MLRLRRFTFRRVLFLASAFLLFWLFVFSLTPITWPLPPYTGSHAVGILDVETEVQRRVINDAILKETGEQAFELSTLAVTLYYPSAQPSTPSHSRPRARPWLPQPISLIGTGYARIAHIHFPPLQSAFTFFLWLFGSSTVIPGVVDAPILSGAEKVVIDESSGTTGLGNILSSAERSQHKEELFELRDAEQEAESEIMGTLPCVVFTHGMAGMSQSYSHYLGSIASHGYVVAAVEHRDGSGPGSIIHHTDGHESKVWHMSVGDLEHDPPMTAVDLRVAQLAFRDAEIEETIRLFRLLNAGHGSLLENLKPDAPGSALAGFKDRLNLSAITIAGHSYGATGAMQAVKNAPSEMWPVNGAIMLDPGKSSGPLNSDIDVPILVMQSGRWTEKQTQFYGQGWHFDVVRKVVQGVQNGWFMTLTGSAHPSCTDAPLIVPWIMKMVTGTTLDSAVALKEYINVSVEFLKFLRDGDKTGVLKSEVTSPGGPLGDSEKRGTATGEFGADWEIHVTPKADGRA